MGTSAHGLRAGAGSQNAASVAVVFALIRTFDLHTDVVSLLLRENRKFRVEFGELQTRHFFIKNLGQHVHADRILVGVFEELNLSEHLVGKGLDIT